MEYLLKVTAIVTIFYIIYKVFLQRDTFFESNRWFLITGLISSLLIPFLVIPIYIEYTPTFYNVTIDGQVVTETVEKPFNILDYLPLIYGLGVVFFSGRFLSQLFSLIKIIYKNKGIKKDGFVFIETPNSTSPFSFFKWIVYNPKAFSQTELEHIIEHEKTHAKQYHSIDILITQLFCVLLWFNPFIWLYNKDLKQNLEFIADKRTLNQYNCKKSYQYTLLKTSMPSHQMALSNHFYNSLIKKRIVMLHKSKSKKINQLKYALVIPVVALFLMGFNTKDIYVEKQNPAQNNSIINKAEKLNDANTYYILDTQKDSDFESMKNHFATKEYAFEISNLKRTETGLIKGITVNIKNETSSANFSTSSILPIKPIKIILDEENNTISIGNLSDTDKKILTGFPSQEKANEYKISKNLNNLLPSDDLNNALLILNGTEVKQDAIKDLNADDIKNVNVLKGKVAVEKYGDKGKNGVVEISTNWETKFIFSKSFDFKKTKDTLKSIQIRGIQTSSGETPLYIINGKEVDADIAKALNPDNIYSVNVLKDEKSTSLYGEKAKNGVVLITTKGNATSFEGKSMNEVKVIGYGANQGTTSHNITFKSEIDGKPILVIVDGKEMPNKNFEDIDQNTIGSIKVLKGEDAIKKYGKKAENGVIEITSKKFVEGKPLSNVKIIGQGEAYTITKTENMFFIDSVGGDKQPLFVLDGKETKYIEITKVSPEKIENVIVLKDKSATKKYGKKGENGVIEITTKK